ncbi:unnamed protein product [Paramecium pentaurelia]|uniref:Uncharacterized protein n=1 Tax=Paramecium pentaurelia TaxID=43138 RepID=A0A8S1UHF8_9CILI|nr:unnamed protein product [Paramecium pentaurelia]
MMLFQQCHEYHQQNQILAQEIEGLKDENDDLSRECLHLEGQSEQQIRYINCLKQLNQKTEEALQKLQVYQEELKQLLHKGKQDQGPKFDPIQFIKSVTDAQQKVDIPQELCEVGENLSFEKEINQVPQISNNEIEVKQGLSFNYKYLAAITATIALGIIIKKKLL